VHKSRAQLRSCDLSADLLVFACWFSTHSLTLIIRSSVPFPLVFLSSRLFSSLLVFSSLLISLFLGFFMSTLLPDPEPALDLDDLDDDDLDSVSHLSWGKNASHLSAVGSASTQSLATPSQLSQPSGLPIDSIARLTHNELCYNLEFMRNVNIIVSLQELLSLRQKSLTSKCELSIPIPSFFLSKLFFKAATHSDCLSSLRPSESASQVINSFPSLPLSYPRPPLRPAHYSQSVLWTWQDLKEDRNIGLSPSNPSRPRMQCVIRDEMGRMLSALEMKSIRQSAIIIACTHLEPLKTSSASAGQRRKKKFYKRHFLTEWLEALKALEVVAPLLSLCFDNWKADLILGWVLQDEHCSEVSHSAPPSRMGPSRPSTPSNLSPSSPPSSLARPPSSLARPPSSLAISSHPAPPSSVSSSSRIAPPSRSSTSSNVAPASRVPHPTPRRVLPPSSQPTQPPAPSGTVQPPSPEPRPAGKAAGPKAKRRRDPSPSIRTGKRSKGDKDTTSAGSNEGASCAPHIH
jgi:hypothetical protein